MKTMTPTSLFVVILLFGCGKSGTTQTSSTEPVAIPNVALQSSNTDCPNGTLLSYRDFGEAFLLAHCTVCHSSELEGEDRAGAPAQVNLDKAEYIALWRVKMLKVVASKNTTMPPGHTLPVGEKNRLKEWLACGASVSDDQL